MTIIGVNVEPFNGNEFRLDIYKDLSYNNTTKNIKHLYYHIDAFLKIVDQSQRQALREDKTFKEVFLQNIGL